ncbi:transcription termination factor NusA [Tundrisphaera sp. TA3]|uniref:transcription termination factor NusA n=1 Tax=Tundrisphaera sp. TA3 TaxID=3435775 RepID=UPI003EB7F6C9
MSVDLVRIVDSIHRDKNIPKDVLFEGIESALATAAKKHYPDAEEITVTIDQDTGKISTLTDGKPVVPPDFGRIAAQTAKQVIIQKIREAERDSTYDEFDTQRGELITGTVKRFEGGAVTVDLGKERDSLLPRSEQIPGESHHPGERVRAVILDVRKVGQRVKIILSRTHPDFVRRLFELEIPEIADQVISIRALAREAGYRSKVAVTSIDAKVDAVGACVGVRGTRIKNIVDELGGERIDIVRWNESLQVLIPNALQPAEIDEVMLCQLLGRAIVLVREDQLSLAIGRRGQNVRLASKLVGWDIEIMTSEELDELIEKAVGTFTRIDGVDAALAEKLVEQGILSYDDLSVMEIADLVNTIEGLDEELAVAIVERAEVLAEEQADDMPRRKGARPVAAPTPPQPAAETAPANGDSPAKTTLADLFDDGPAEGDDGTAPADALPADEEQDEADRPGEEPRDLALAAEVSDRGHEVTSAPSDDDQDETDRLVTEAVESGGSPEEAEANPAGEGPNTPPLPPTEPFTTDEEADEPREPEMHQP